MFGLPLRVVVCVLRDGIHKQSRISPVALGSASSVSAIGYTAAMRRDTISNHERIGLADIL